MLSLLFTLLFVFGALAHPVPRLSPGPGAGFPGVVSHLREVEYPSTTPYAPPLSAASPKSSLLSGDRLAVGIIVLLCLAVVIACAAAAWLNARRHRNNEPATPLRSHGELEKGSLSSELKSPLLLQLPELAYDGKQRHTDFE